MGHDDKPVSAEQSPKGPSEQKQAEDEYAEKQDEPAPGAESGLPHEDPAD